MKRILILLVFFFCFLGVGIGYSKILIENPSPGEHYRPNPGLDEDKVLEQEMKEAIPGKPKQKYIERMKELNSQIQPGKPLTPQAESERYKIAKILLKSIEKGKTTDKEIREWFGNPEWETDSEGYSTASVLWKQYIDAGYLTLTLNQKIVGYKFYAEGPYVRNPFTNNPVAFPNHPIVVTYSCPILLTFNKVTGVVENFGLFEDYEKEAMPIY